MKKLVVLAATGLALGAYSHGDLAAETTSAGHSPSTIARPVYGPLSASQTSHIQMLGRSILAAKHQQQPSPQEQALVGALSALSNELDTITQPTASTEPLLLNTARAPVSGNTSMSNVPIGSAASGSVSSLDERIKQKIIPRLDAFHTIVSPRDDSSAGASLSEAQSARLVVLRERAADIEAQVRAALAEQGSARFAKLIEWRDRLKPKTQDELVRERYASQASRGETIGSFEPSTPTIVTRISHRPMPGKSGRPTN